MAASVDKKMSFAEQLTVRMQKFADTAMQESVSSGIQMFNSYLDTLEPLNTTKQRIKDLQDDFREWTADQTERQEKQDIAEQEKDKQEAEQKHEEAVAEDGEKKEVERTLNEAKLHRTQSLEHRNREKPDSKKKSFLFDAALLLLLGWDKISNLLSVLGDYLEANFPKLYSLVDSIASAIGVAKKFGETWKENPESRKPAVKAGIKTWAGNTWNSLTGRIPQGQTRLVGPAAFATGLMGGLFGDVAKRRYEEGGASADDVDFNGPVQDYTPAPRADFETVPDMPALSMPTGAVGNVTNNIIINHNHAEFGNNNQSIITGR